jgi:putative membrane protein
MTSQRATREHDPPTTSQGAPQAPGQRHVVRRTRTGGAWVTLALGALILVLLLIFILQNGHRVDVSFLGAHGHLPLGVAMLLAAVGGILLVAIPGTGRIMQLRRTARRHGKAADSAMDEAAAAKAANQAPGAAGSR